MQQQLAQLQQVQAVDYIPQALQKFQGAQGTHQADALSRVVQGLQNAALGLKDLGVPVVDGVRKAQ